MDKGIRRREYFVADGDVYTDSEFNRIVKEALHKKVVIRLKVPLWLVKPAAVCKRKNCFDARPSHHFQHRQISNHETTQLDMRYNALAARVELCARISD